MDTVDDLRKISALLRGRYRLRVERLEDEEFAMLYQDFLYERQDFFEFLTQAIQQAIQKAHNVNG